ncbi:MBL fold metallo-hydrolase [Shumkonia mesophila]|uniref:MBL fold metallo-hydrolase n=1 Tax=Shumkonia mesophila TaxID=2838854 RepID=UPI0029351068|nr:MBL fold metallo-hydrolase [Shumkonia mesophila]
MEFKIKFCGAARTVTGSCYHVSVPGFRFLVDCGMFQGTKTIRELNYGDFPFDAKAVDAVFLTHAHIDHTGLLPKLLKSGFDGPVFATEATRDLLTYMLPDSGHIQEFEVKRINQRNRRRDLPPVFPIYTKEDGARAAEGIRYVPLEEWFDGGPGVRVRFWNAGHILGSASIEFELAAGKGNGSAKRILFSGDVGPDQKTLQSNPQGPKDLDYLVVESTYGDRDRSDLSPEARRGALKAEIDAAVKSGGNILIPAFAVERTQELLFDLGMLMDEGQIPQIQIYLDSPLAIRATEVFEKHSGHLEGINGTVNPFRHPSIRFIQSVDESMALEAVRSGAIIMAASGMCDAGRIRHHLLNNLSNPKATVLFVGYQAPGTLGSLILDGAKKVRIHGQEVSVKARIRSVDFYSAHADREQIVDWIRARLPVAGGIFLSHGEQSVIEALRSRLIKAQFDPNLVFVPQLDEVFDLAIDGAPKRHLDRPRLDPASVSETATSDWHNDYAALLLELANDLRTLPDVETRRRLLVDLRRTLKGGERAA